MMAEVVNRKSKPEHTTIASLKYLAVHQIRPVTHAPLVGKTLEAAHKKMESAIITARAVGICHRLRLGNLFRRNERNVVSTPKTTMVIGANQMATKISSASQIASQSHTWPYQLYGPPASLEQDRICVDTLNRNDNKIL